MKTALSGIFLTLVVALCSGVNADRAPRYLFSKTPTWSSWSKYDACTPSCNGGTKTRTRYCIVNYQKVDTSQCNGAVSLQFETCTQSDCTSATPTYPSPTHGTWSQWTSYTHCSVSCGTGTYHRRRFCQGHLPCVGHSTDTHTCHMHSCPATTTTPAAPVNGNWGPWTAYTHCSHSCGSGTMTRRRACNHPAPAHGGHTCHGSSIQTTVCHAPACATTTTTPAPVNGHWGSWSAYSQCSHTCGSGLITRHRSCNHPSPAHGGHSCYGSSTQTMACHLKACVVNGGWGTWAHWTSCSATCNLGTISRTRACNHPAPAHGGATCAGNTTETHECSNGPCPVWTHWIEGTCSVSCGNGTRERVRHCSTGKDGDCGGVAYQQVPCTHVTCV